MGKQKNCLFVCTGNTCRSQMAHALGQQLINQQDLAWAVDSAGISAKVGSVTTPDAVAVLHEQGMAWQGLSQQLSEAQLRWADEIWVMTQEHLTLVTQMQQGIAASEQAQIKLLLGDKELGDPLGCGRETYVQVLAILQRRLPQLLTSL